jgi:hypothetical protein
MIGGVLGAVIIETLVLLHGLSIDTLNCNALGCSKQMNQSALRIRIFLNSTG